MKRTFSVTSGGQLRCRGWRQEGLLRLLENVLAVGEDPDNLVVYAALGRAARDWPSHDRIVETLKTIGDGETLLVQSGKPIGLVKTHAKAPVVIMANCNMVGQWAKAEHFYELASKNLICWGGLTAGDWQYIGSQGVIQGTYEIFMRIAARHFGGDLAGRFVLTAGLGGMGGAQPLAGTMAKAAILCVEVDEKRIDKRMAIGFLDAKADTLDQALDMIRKAQAGKQALSVGLCANAADVYPEILRRGVVPDVVTDQTSAHDLVYGYVPAGRSLEEVRAMRTSDPKRLMEEATRSIVRHVGAMLEFQKQGRGGLRQRQSDPDAGQERRRRTTPSTSRSSPRRSCGRCSRARSVRSAGWRCPTIPTTSARSTTCCSSASATIRSCRTGSGSRASTCRSKACPRGSPGSVTASGPSSGSRSIAWSATATLSAPIAFTRDHLDAGAMAHPNIMTENMRDGSDAIADWPLLNAMVNCASQADLVAIHSGGGGYSGYMTSAGVTLIADGTDAADERLSLSLTNDTATGVMRYADAGYEDALDEARRKNIDHFRLGDG